jgi:hypothetical protein
MKKLLVLTIILSILVTTISCNVTSPNTSKSVMKSDSQPSEENQYDKLLTKIESLETEIAKLKIELAKKDSLNSLADIIKNTNNSRTYLGSTVENSFIKTVDIKLPKKVYEQLQCVILTGEESDDGTVSFKETTFHIYGSIGSADKYNKYGIDEKEFVIYSFAFHNIKFDNNSCMIILLTDGTEFQHQEFVHSLNFEKDV